MIRRQQDSSSRGLFRTFQREHRPLSAYLHRSIAVPLLALVDRMDATQLEVDDATLLEGLIARGRFCPPRLLGAEVASSRDGGGEWRPGLDPGTRVATNRHYIAIQIEGAHDILEYWPDQEDGGLEPIDSGFDDALCMSTEGVYDYDSELRRHEWRLVQELWSLGLRNGPDSWALFTFVDLTSAEEEEVLEGRLSPRAVADQNRRKIEPIVEALARQSARFLQDELPQTLREALAARRRSVDARIAVRESLTWPTGWKAKEPQLEISPPTSGEVYPTEIQVSHRPRLASTTFAEVQTIIRLWADAVERYPDAFSPLKEDRLSDLLTATLNASLPGANREVYSRGGKSDIFIRADVLREGFGPAKVFICESKWWSGPGDVSDHLEQLFDYLETKDTAAVLIYFVGALAPQAIRDSARGALATPAYVGEGHAVVEGWPVLRYQVGDRDVDVCVAFVDLPRRRRR